MLSPEERSAKELLLKQNIRTKKVELDKQFTQIVSEGTGKKWDLSHNQRWIQETR